MKLDNQAKNRDLVVIDCGVAGYDETLTRQTTLHERRQSGEIEDTVLVVEHPPSSPWGPGRVPIDS